MPAHAVVGDRYGTTVEVPLRQAVQGAAREAEQRGAREADPLHEHRQPRELVEEIDVRGAHQREGQREQLGEQHHAEHHARVAEIREEKTIRRLRGGLRSASVYGASRTMQRHRTLPWLGPR